MTGNEEGDGAHVADSPSVPLALSLVIPAFNEALRLEDGVARLQAAVAAGALAPEAVELIVVDDGSTDQTSSRAAELLASFPHLTIVRLEANRGKGAAVRAGVAAASAPIIAFADADMAIDPTQTPEFMTALIRHDVAIGSRAASGATVDRASIRRSAMNRVFNRLVNVLIRVRLNDTQCGFKAFRAPVAKLLFHCSVTERFAFDVEILSLARRCGFSIAEVPVHWLRVKGSRIRPLTDVGSMARDVLRASRSVANAPAVAAWRVTRPGGGAAGSYRPTLSEQLRRQVPPGLPVLQRPDGTVLVLCPLMDEAGIVATAAQLAAAAPDAEVERTVLTAAQLCAEAPLSLTWDDEVVIAVAE